MSRINVERGENRGRVIETSSVRSRIYVAARNIRSKENSRFATQIKLNRSRKVKGGFNPLLLLETTYSSFYIYEDRTIRDGCM